MYFSGPNFWPIVHTHFPVRFHSFFCLYRTIFKITAFLICMLNSMFPSKFWTFKLCHFHIHNTCKFSESFWYTYWSLLPRHQNSTHRYLECHDHWPVITPITDPIPMQAAPIMASHAASLWRAWTINFCEKHDRNDVIRLSARKLLVFMPLLLAMELETVKRLKAKLQDNARPCMWSIDNLVSYKMQNHRILNKQQSS